MQRRPTTRNERGAILVVIVFIAAAIAALAAISSGRVVQATRQQKVLESETRAYNEAYAQLQMALNVVNGSPYSDSNRNLELLGAINGDNGGTAAGETDYGEEWLKDPSGIVHGKVRGTGVRVYRGKDYIQRLARLKGTSASEVDPLDESRSYYVLEAAGRAGDTVRLVSALVRENEPFSSFVLFQNRHTLGVSGAPRGLIHANDQVAFYFPNGSYVDSVTAVNGFDYQAGASDTNTEVRNGNPEATEISLDAVDFEELKTKAEFFAGEDGLDAEIKFYSDGRVRVRQYTPPRHEMVEVERSEDELVGWETRTVTETERVQTGTVQEERTRQVQDGTRTEFYIETVQVQVGTREEERTREVPVYERQTVTCTRWVRVFVPYDDGSGGTTVGGGGEGVPGEYQWVEEEYECEQDVIVGYETETYTETVPVYIEQEIPSIREVPVYRTETYTVDIPVYEDREVEVERDFPVYETRTWTETREEFVSPEQISTDYLDVPSDGGTMYIDGRVTRLYGDLRGRVTIVGNEKVRVTGNVRYVDDQGEPAMRNGDDYTEPYVRNEDYRGQSVLGVVAREDVVLTRDLPQNTEINATLMSVLGRVGIDGFAIDENGEPYKDRYFGAESGTPEYEKERAYNRTGYSSGDYRRESLRRIGGVVSNDRILETYIRSRSDGTSYVDEGFKRGSMRYDFNLLFNPPPNFVEVPRPVVTSVAPIYFVRNRDD